MKKSKTTGIIRLRSTLLRKQVGCLYIIFLVIAIAANKGDLYEEEKVEEIVGRNFAKEIGAIFRYTSAKNASGIDDLFKAIGNKLIDPNYEEGGKVEEDVEHERIRQQTVKLTNKNKGEKKDGGCGC